MVLERPLIVGMNSTERTEAIDAGFAHLVQSGATGELRPRLTGDRTLGERLAAAPCPFGTAGPASG